MEDLLFSVAIITYNQEKYISQTLDSILQQRHSFKYEIVIGDDCSTDGTQEIIKKYAEKYPDIIKTIFNNPNLGIIKNYFNVINHCSGKYIMECAGDDFWLPEKVQTQIDFMEQNPEVGMCYGYAKKWLESKQCFSKKYFGSKKETMDELLEGNDIPAPTVCFRNELIKKYIDEVHPIEKGWLMEDYPEWLWFAGNSKITFIQKSLAVYRELNDSASHILNVEKQFAFNKNYYSIQKFYAEQNYKNVYIKTDEEILFDIYYASLLNCYTKETRNKLITVSKIINNLGIHRCLIVLFARTYFTFCIFKILK